MIKASINLYQAELKPVKRLMTLQNVVFLWGFVFVFMAAIAVYTHMQSTSLHAQADQLRSEKTQLQAQMNRLKQQLENHKADPELAAQLDTLKSLSANKRYLYSHLTNTEDSYIGGFALAMEELASLHSKDISLQHVVIQEHQMSFSGLARNANAVPTWLSNFELSKVLSGKTFQHMSMAEQEDGQLIEFSVSSNAPFAQEDR